MNNDLSDVFLSVTINKSNPGEVDSDGNYIFEVEASNENLDLQNQIIQQKALLNSKEYFLTNGVISDDHQHKTKDKNGHIETHKERIIGEPIKIWTEGPRTFVKGKLYSNNKYAKEYINLLKAGSTRVHASVGGFMSKVKYNNNGTESVTAFMWNDLALTCSPVNWTVGSAKFSKSMSNIDFCKALTDGSGVNPLIATNGEALKKEDLENKPVNILEATSIEKTDDEDDEDEKIIKETIKDVKKGNLKSEKEIRSYLMGCGFSKIKATEVAEEIMKQGEIQMKKSGFFHSISEKLNKSFGSKSEGCQKSEDTNDDEKSKKTKSEEDDDDENENINDDDDFNFSDDDENGDDEMSKSIVDADYTNAQMVMQEMSKSIVDTKDETLKLRERIARQEEEIEELKKAVEECADWISIIGKTPQVKKSVTTIRSNPDYNADYEAPTKEEYYKGRDAICKAKVAGDIHLKQANHLDSVLQKSYMTGERMNPEDEKLIKKFYAKYGEGTE